MDTGGEGREEEPDGVSVHSPCKALPSSVSSLSKEHWQVELEIKMLEALEIYPPFKLQGLHRHFVLFGLMEFLRRSFERQFSSDEVLQLLDRFYNLEMLVTDLIQFTRSNESYFAFALLSDEMFAFATMLARIRKPTMKRPKS